MTRLLIVAGEVSGDLYGAKLVESLLKQDPSVEIWAVGGDRLREASHRFVFETAYSHSVGIEGVFKSMAFGKNVRRALSESCQSAVFDGVVIIDFQHHNFALASLFQSYHIPITTWITPNFWIWKDCKQARKLAAYSCQIIPIFEKEAALYRSLHEAVHYVGHPLVDIVTQVGPRATTGVAIALFPGSRTQEIEMYFPKMLETARLLTLKNPQYHFHIAIANPRFERLLKSMAAGYSDLDIQWWTSLDKSELFSHTDFLMCASGSVALEAVLYRVPMGIFCALPRLTYWAAKYLLRLKMAEISLPNIIAGKIVVPEWVQDAILPGPISEQIHTLIRTRSQSDWETIYAPILKSMTPFASPITEVAKRILTSA